MATEWKCQWLRNGNVNGCVNGNVNGGVNGNVKAAGGVGSFPPFAKSAKDGAPSETQIPFGNDNKRGGRCETQIPFGNDNKKRNDNKKGMTTRSGDFLGDGGGLSAMHRGGRE